MLFDSDNPKAFFKNVDFFAPSLAITGGSSTLASASAIAAAPTIAGNLTLASVAAPVAAGGGFLSTLVTGLQIFGGITALTRQAGAFDTEAELTRDTGAQLREDARVAAIAKRIDDKKKIAKTKAATPGIFDPDAGTPLFIEALNEETSNDNIDNIIKAGEGQAGALDAEAEIIQAKSTQLNVAAGIRAVGAGVSLLNS